MIFASRTREIFHLGRIFPGNIELDLELTTKVISPPLTNDFAELTYTLPLGAAEAVLEGSS